MKKFFVAVLIIAQPALAQQPAATPPPINIILKDGRTVTTAQALGRSGNAVMVTVPTANNGQGQVGYETSAISRIEFPEPPQIRTAIDLLTTGRRDDGIAQLEPVLSYYAPFREVPGSWWSRAAVLKIDALINSGREKEAASLVAELSECHGDPDAIIAASIQQAAATGRKGAYEAALRLLDADIKQTQNKENLAHAWLYKGDSLAALRQWEPAILAYLHVPVFYSGERSLVPRAMLGGAEAMIGLQDRKSARDQLDDLVKNYAFSPQATTAKIELGKLDELEKEQKQTP